MKNQKNQSKISGWQPEVIPVTRYEDYHTHYIGKTEQGLQFFGYETFVFPDGIPETDWQKSRKEYVVLYIFDKEGNYLETKHWYAGTTSEVNYKKTTEKLEEMIHLLGSVEYTDINIKPFQTVIDGTLFGLIPSDNYECINLQPSNTISFTAPWDGEYDTWKLSRVLV